jgi:hypothetical protein
MKFVPKWNGNSVSFFAKLNDPPLPIPALLSPAKLFNIVFNGDGSFYTEYFGGGQALEEKHVLAGLPAHHKTDAIPHGQKCRFSIHGSGEVRSFIRDEKEVISHLGYEIREIEVPVLLAQHRIGSAGEYIQEPFTVQVPKPSGVLVDGVFGQPLRPVFSLHVAPEDFSPQGDGLVWHGITKPMDNGRKLSVAVEISYEDWPEGQSRDHEFRVFSKSVA